MKCGKLSISGGFLLGLAAKDFEHEGKHRRHRLTVE
jgi:hypothetical protein